MAKVAQSLAKLISQSKKKKTGPYDTRATVKRVEGNTVWVSIPGGVDETPINKTVNCSAGDKVQVRVSGSRAWITGNASAPPTDDKTANEAKTKAVVAEAAAIDAKETAKAVESVAVNANTTATNAQHIAEGVNEHFWHDNTGAHVTEVTQEEWNEPTDPNYHSGGNTLITTQGMAIRNGLTNLAEFGATGATIGQNVNGLTRAEISTDGMQIITNVSGSDRVMAHIGYGLGNDDTGSLTYAPFYTLGRRQMNDPTQIGNYSTVEGRQSTASGFSSHAEGFVCASSGKFSHAEGDNAYAGGLSSHAQNSGTRASSDAQTALGKFNIEDNADTYACIIGNGTAYNARSNALTVDWSGNVEASGDITDGSNNVLSSKADSAGFFKTVDLSWAEPAINAHDHGTATTHTVPAADIPDGMTLVGIVGWTSGNYRIYPYVFHTNGANSISVTMANATAANSASTTVHAYLLYIKATSA